LLITPQHQELQEKYQKLVLKSMQFDMIIQQKDEQVRQLYSQITPLKNVFEQLSHQVKELEARYESALKLLEEKDKRLQRLELIEHQYEQLKKLVYSRSSEKQAVAMPGQLLLGIDAEVVEACNIGDGQKIASYTKAKLTREKHSGRNELPAHIERKYVDLYPEDFREDTERFDTIETEQLEYDPARLFATVYRRYKYKRSKPDGSVEFFIATLPEEKDKSLAAPSLKAHVTTEKYLWHMPIHRQMQKFGQSGIILSENTIGDWINGTCRSLTAIYDALRENIVRPACGYMMADETHITVLDRERGKGKKSHIGFMWAYCNPVTAWCFLNTSGIGAANMPGRSSKTIKSTFIVMDNVYKHYGSLEGVPHVNGNAHVRRKLHEAKFTDRKRAEYALELYGKLYAIESYCRKENLNFDERKRIRQEKSVPIFEELATWVKDQWIQTSLRIRSDHCIGQKQLYVCWIARCCAERSDHLLSTGDFCKLHDVNAYDWLKFVLTAMPTFSAAESKNCCRRTGRLVSLNHSPQYLLFRTAKHARCKVIRMPDVH